MQVLSKATLKSTMAASAFWLCFVGELFERVACSDKKRFVLFFYSNMKTNHFWVPLNAYDVVEFKKAHAGKGVGIHRERLLPARGVVCGLRCQSCVMQTLIVF